MSKGITIHPLIKSPLIFFIIVVMCSVVIVLVSESYLARSYDGRESEKRAMRIWKNKIDGSRESNRIIDEYEKRYFKLVKNNVVGDEDRLNWLETIQSSANEKGIIAVKYNLGQQNLVIDKTGDHRALGLMVYRSIMTLDMTLAHEGDLFVILNTLKDKAQGLFTVDNCNIEMHGEALGDGVGNLHAFCELGWYTLKSAENSGS